MLYGVVASRVNVRFLYRSAYFRLIFVFQNDFLIDSQKDFLIEQFSRSQDSTTHAQLQHVGMAA